MKKGWHRESKRHSLAARGVKTKRSGYKIPYQSSKAPSSFNKLSPTAFPEKQKEYFIPVELEISPNDSEEEEMQKRFLIGREIGRIQREQDKQTPITESDAEWLAMNNMKASNKYELAQRELEAYERDALELDFNRAMTPGTAENKVFKNYLKSLER